MVSIHFVVEGRVQMVGFRYFLKQKAEDLQITGWTRNTKDEKVEGVIQGIVENISRMQEYIKKGPTTADVLNYSFKEVDNKDFDGFVIRD